MPAESIPFRPYNEREDVRIYQNGILPHWRQRGCTYFVTFRLADSLPQSVLQELESTRQNWLARRGIDADSSGWKQQFATLPREQQREYEREIGKAMNEQLDRGYGACELRSPANSAIVANGLTHFQDERVWTGDYVVMPNHVHALMTPIPPYELEEILKSIKGFTGKEVNRRTGSGGQFWQRQSYDHIVREREQLRRFQKYIRENPIKARLSEGCYRWRSAEYEFD